MHLLPAPLAEPGLLLSRHLSSVLRAFGRLVEPTISWKRGQGRRSAHLPAGGRRQSC